MKLIITDCGTIWNPQNPYLKEFKKAVICISVNGMDTNGEYTIFKPPHQNMMGGLDYLNDLNLQNLYSVSQELIDLFGYHEDVVILADNDPCTLYPYVVLKDHLNKNNYHLHLIVNSPWDFEGDRKCQAHRKLLTDLTKLDSLLYFNSNSILPQKSLAEAEQAIQDTLGYNLVHFLNGISNLSSTPCFFNFQSMSYVPVSDGFTLQKKAMTEISHELNFNIGKEYLSSGRVYRPDYPSDDQDILKEVERLYPRPDGKKICSNLREQRILLARANHIPFSSEECMSIGPCGGTCQKCDEESEYLRQQMEKIPKEDRIYPEMILDQGVK